MCKLSAKLCSRRIRCLSYIPRYGGGEGASSKNRCRFELVAVQIESRAEAKDLGCMAEVGLSSWYGNLP
jgi:hypothetical protein